MDRILRGRAETEARLFSDRSCVGLQIKRTARDNAGLILSPAEESYLNNLCGTIGEKSIEPNAAERQRIRRAFDQACQEHTTLIARYPEVKLPGLKR